MNLQTWLADRPAGLADVVACVAAAGTAIADALAHGAFAVGAADDAGRQPSAFAEELLGAALDACPAVAAWSSASRSETSVIDGHSHHGEYLVSFDALGDGARPSPSHGLGTIFSILAHPLRGTPPGEAGFLQPGRRLVAAGCIAYGHATMMFLSCGSGVVPFAYDRRSGEWVRMLKELQVPAQSREVAIDLSSQRHWDKPVQRYIAECLAGESGPRAADFSLRWSPGLAFQARRIMCNGGVFLSPRDQRDPRLSGRLRLLHEAAPVAWLAEQAGGIAVAGTQCLLDIVPDTLHQKVPLVFGSRDEVALIVAYHEEPHENVGLRLFKTRSLFVQPQG